MAGRDEAVEVGNGGWVLQYSLGSLCTKSFSAEHPQPQFSKTTAEDHRELLCSQFVYVCVGGRGVTITSVLDLQLE